MDRDGTAVELGHVPLFHSLDPALQREIAGMAATRRIARGEVLFGENDVAGFLPILLAGSVRLYRTGADGREQMLHLVRAPATFAEAAVFGPGVFPATAEAVAAGRLATVPRDAFLDLLRRRPEVPLALLASLSVWMRRLVDLVEGLSLHTVEERVAAYLQAVFARAGAASEPGAEVRLDEPKHLIAALCGTAPEVLSRTFRKLEDGGAVRIRGPVATLLDPEELRRRAGG